MVQVQQHNDPTPHLDTHIYTQTSTQPYTCSVVFYLPPRSSPANIHPFDETGFSAFRKLAETPPPLRCNRKTTFSESILASSHFSAGAQIFLVPLTLQRWATQGEAAFTMEHLRSALASVENVKWGELKSKVKTEHVALAVGAVAAVGGTWMLAKYFAGDRLEADAQMQGTSRRRTVRRPWARGLELNEFERRLERDVIDPSVIESGFGDVGALEAQVRSSKSRLSLRSTLPLGNCAAHIRASHLSLVSESQIVAIHEQVILPLTKPHLFARSKLAIRPTGVLLYGPPGM
jgi:hypothetical protein